MKRVETKLVFVIFLLIFSPFTFADLVGFQGKALYQGVLVDSGNISVSIYDAPTGGILVYNETFVGVVERGFFDVVLGNSTPLDLNYGSTYYVDLSINGNDIDWQGQERKVFESSVGSIDQSLVFPSCEDRESLAYNASSASWECSKGTEVVPIGSVLAFSQNNCPTGWIMTDGSDVSRTTYSDLFSVIGTMYGVGDGSSTFTLPDYRGYFLRGTDGGAGVDPDAASRTDRGDGTAGDNVGTKQDDGISSHLHSVNPPSTPSGTNSVGHTHTVDPPDSGSSTVSNHRHTVDPPQEYTTYVTPTHTHALSTTSNDLGSGPYLFLMGRNDGISMRTTYSDGASHRHSIDIGQFDSGYDGGHSHTTNIGPFSSQGVSQSHTHDVDISPFDSDSAGGSEVRPKNVNVLYCIKANQVVTVLDDERFSASGNSVYLNNLSDYLGVGTASPEEKLTLKNGSFLISHGDPVEMGSLVDDGVGGSASYLGYLNYIYVRGSYAYVAAYGDNSFTIVDIKDPINPVEVGSLNIPSPVDVEVKGRYAYVTSGGADSLYIIDVIDPSNPVEVGSIVDGVGATTLDAPKRVSVDGDYAYVISYLDSGVSIIDVSDPANPVEAYTIIDDFWGGSATALEYPSDVFVSQGYAYTTSNSEASFSIFDVSDPSSPIEMSYLRGGLDTTHSLSDFFFIKGDYAYVLASSTNAMSIIDISNRSSPFEVGYVSDGAGASNLGNPKDIFVSGDYAYITSFDDDGLTVIDVSDPSSPVEVGFVTDNDPNWNLDQAYGVFLQGRYAYVTSNAGSALTVIELDGFKSPSGEIGSLEVSNLDVETFAKFDQGVDIKGGLNVGKGGIVSYGDVSFGEGSFVVKNGNVGISTTSPSYNLDVNGTGRFTGGLTAPTISRRNLLINSDFRINQEGYAADGLSSLGPYEYGHDMWRAFGVSTTLKYTKESDGSVTINSYSAALAGATEGLYQKNDELVNLDGEVITVSLVVNSISADIDISASGVTQTISSPGTYSFSGTADSSGEFTMTHTATAGEVPGTINLNFNFEQLKVERGSTATQYEVPEERAEEARCYWYYRKLIAPSAGVLSDMFPGVSIGGSSFFWVPYRMRTLSAVSGTGLYRINPGDISPDGLTVTGAFEQSDSGILVTTTSVASIDGSVVVGLITGGSAYLELDARY